MPSYRLSIRQLYTRVQAATWALLRFIRLSGLQGRAKLRHFLAAVGPRPGGSLVPGDAGGSGALRGRW
jgi:hypothetical protein